MDEVHPIVGHDGAIEAFGGALKAGRVHHAWLLTGEAGIGKFLFAQHAAAVLLSGKKVPFRSALTTPQARQMLQGSHPDFRLLQPEEGKATVTITVEQVRTMSAVFQTTAAMGGWRVVVIDAADDLNRSAANALLKLLEEPPARSVFFLVSHAPGRLLPTIRSRCRALRFDALTDADVTDIALAHLPDGAEEISAVLPYANGSPGRALTLLDGHALDYAAAIDGLLSQLPQLDRRAMLGFADQMGDRSNSPAYQTGWTLLEDAAARAVRASTGMAEGYGGVPLERWLAFADGLKDGKRQIEGLNLSPRQLLISLFAQLAPIT